MASTRIMLLVVVTVLASASLVLAGQSAFGHPENPPSESSVGVEALLGAAFTYQGQLKDGSSSVNDVCDFEFSLWNSRTGGAQLGAVVSRDGLKVSDGLFTAQLDFGSTAFNGNERFLEIAVRCPTGSGSMTTMLPRQALTSAPYALYAKEAPWAGIIGAPAGLASLGALRCTSGQVPKWSGAGWSCAADANAIYSAGAGLTITGAQFSVKFGGSGTANTAARGDHDHDSSYEGKYIRTIVVSPVGTVGQNGTALLDALSNIKDASQNKPYLVRIEPGVYDTGDAMAMKQWVDIEGSGELVTIIRGGNCTLKGANNAELRFLTVESYGVIALPTSEAICNLNASPRITHVTAVASGGSYTYGVLNENASPIMTSVTVIASGPTYNYGVKNESSSPTIRDSIIRAVGGTTSNVGVYSYAASGSHTTTITNSRIVAATRTIWSQSSVTTRVAASELDGGSVANDDGGKTVCAGVYDGSFVFYSSSCP